MDKEKIKFEEGIAIERVDESDLFRLLDYPKYFDLMQFPLPSGRELINKLSGAGIIAKMSGGGIGITNLGAVLFAKDLNDFDGLVRKAVRVIVYDGKGRTRGIKEQEETLGYALGLDGLIEYVSNELPAREEIKNAFRRSIKLYPDIAIRELATNMLIHQDFSVTGTGPKVEIFDGRVEFTNPGHPLVDPLRFVDENPKSLNEKLARIMRMMNFCEERGSGIDKTIEESERFHLPGVEFVVGSHSFKAILHAPKKLNEMSRDEKVRACYQHCCLRHVSQEKMTNRSLRERFQIDGKNSAQASRIIKQAIAEELVKPFDERSHSKREAGYVPFWA